MQDGEPLGADDIVGATGGPYRFLSGWPVRVQRCDTRYEPPQCRQYSLQCPLLRGTQTDAVCYSGPIQAEHRQSSPTHTRLPIHHLL